MANSTHDELLESLSDKDTQQDNEKNVDENSDNENDMKRKFTKKTTKNNTQKDDQQIQIEEEKAEPVSIKELFRFASRRDLLMLTIGALTSIAHGAMLPLFTILFGDTLNSFGPDGSMDELTKKVGEIALQLLYLAIGAFCASFLQVYCLTVAGQSQANKIRELYMKSVLSQEMAWYDRVDSGQLTARVVGDVNKISDGIGDKLGSIFQQLSTFVTGFIIGFVYGWKLTLVVLSVTPLLIVSGVIFSKILASATTESQSAYAKAGAIAGEALSLIRTVVAFGGEPQEKARYDESLIGAYKVGAKRAHVTGLAIGVVFLIINLVYALAFWYGNELAIRGQMTTGSVLTVFLSIVIGAMSAGQAAPAFAAVTEARGAAPTVYAIIDKIPEINSMDAQGDIPAQCQGKITLDNIHFTYPTRPDTKILHGISLELQVGKSTAFVGESGCGKSTVMQLMSRFYDPEEGTVALDDKDIRTINVQWLRSQTGLVSQTPTLFKMTVAENIAFGAGVDISTEGSGQRVFRTKEVSKEDIIAAAKAANAHKFIMKLPEGYDTMIGERGAMLSGGQKQRIAIARALIRNPKILLLDEATSALDTKSEKVVQDALESAQKGRTTVIIAHRLSTVRNADCIVVFGKGHIKEKGTHDELMKIPNGAYRSMVESQQGTNQDDAGVDDAQDPDEIPAAAEMSVNSGHDELHQKSDASYSHHLIHAVSEAYSHTEYSQKVDKLDLAAISEKEKESDDGFFRILTMNKEEWHWMVLGLFGAAVSGVVWPMFAMVFSEIIAVMGVADNQSDVDFWSCMFIVLGAAAMFGNYAAAAGFEVCAEKLTMKLRSQSFETILHQEMGFFDLSENSVGALCHRLSSEAQTVSNLSGSKVKIITITLSTIIAGVVIAFTNCWRLALVVLAFIPVIGVGSFLQLKVITGFADAGSKMFAEAGQVANEAIDNIRTASALVRNKHFYNRYCEEIQGPLKAATKKAFIAGLGFGFTEFVQFIIWAVAFYYGSKLTETGQCDFLQVMNSITALLFGAMTLGQASAQLPDVAEGKNSAAKVFTLLDRQSKLDVRDESGERPDKCQGQMEFKDLIFEYPTRPDVPVLRGLSVNVQPGKTLALVGESGCGKSTLIALTERFYDVRDGTISLDSRNVYGLNVKWLRSQIGIVSQEPDLFDTTIRENILYGLRKDNPDTLVVTDELVINAAKQANAHDFISSLPEGYDTKVGERGNHLSGGQKQRVAIARALIRDPTILLLDEATAALDVKSEKVVQEALEAASEGRTTIIVAHRLSTIRNADMIAVVAGGEIVEHGTDAELMAKKGAYSLLVQNQTNQQ